MEDCPADRVAGNRIRIARTVSQFRIADAFLFGVFPKAMVSTEPPIERE